MARWFDFKNETPLIINSIRLLLYYICNCLSLSLSLFLTYFYNETIHGYSNYIKIVVREIVQYNLSETCRGVRKIKNILPKDFLRSIT